jgi:hypothetical protein
MTPVKKPRQRSEKMLKNILDKQNVGCEKLYRFHNKKERPDEQYNYR